MKVIKKIRFKYTREEKEFVNKIFSKIKNVSIIAQQNLL